MKITFYELTIDFDIQGVIKILSFELEGNLNEHTTVKLRCLLEEDRYEESVLFTATESNIVIYDIDSILFYGYLMCAHALIDKGDWVLELEYASKTCNLDIIKRKRAFHKLDSLYTDVISKVLSTYQGIDIKDEIAKSQRAPKMLMQYDETDWEFLKRLASHFGSYIIPDTSSEITRFFFGIPDIDNNINISCTNYEIIQDVAQYHRNINIMKQEHICWRIRDRLAVQLGEKIIFNNISVIVSHIHIYVDQGDLIREYTLNRKEGLFTELKINYEILGLSLPASVINRKDNLIQVEFDINSAYESEQPSNYFVYSIESSSFYCMPELGSRIHIYFPNKNEAEGIAVHALNIGNYSNNNPANKVFSTPYGAAIQLTPTFYEFKSDTLGASVLNLGVDGNIKITGTNIVLDADKRICIGEGEEFATPDISISALTEQTINVNENDSSIIMSSDTVFAADKVTMKAKNGNMSLEASNIRDSLEQSDENLITDYNRKQQKGLIKKALPLGSTFLVDIGEVALDNSTLHYSYDYNENNGDGNEEKTSNGLEIKRSFSNKKNFRNYKNGDINLFEPKYYGLDKMDSQEAKESEIKNTTYSVNRLSSQSIENTRKVLGSSIPHSYKKAKGSASIGVAYAYATVYEGLTKEKGGIVAAPGVGVELGAGASAVDLNATYYLIGDKDSKMLDVHVGGSVSCLKGEAKAGAAAGVDKKGKLHTGVNMGVGVYLIEGDVSGGIEIAGIDATVKAEGKIGIGVNIEGGVVGGKLKIKLGAAVGVGGSIDISLDFKDLVGIVCGWWET